MGSYPPTSQSGTATIRRDLQTYFRDTTPWTPTLADKFQAESYLDPENAGEVYDNEEGWVRVLVSRLAKYELTKGEVVMILNLGLGMEDWEGRMPPRLRGGADGVRSAEEQRASDEWVLGAVCEELEQRFGAEEVAGILATVGEVVREARQGGEGGGGGRPVADRVQGMVSEWRAKTGRRGMDGADESGDVEVEEEEEEQVEAQ